MTKFQRLHRTYVLDCSAESFRELLGFLTNAVRNRETFRVGGDQASGDRIFDSFNAYRRATWQSENEVPADYTPSSSIPATLTSLCVKSGTPNSLRSNASDAKSGDDADYEPEVQELFDMFIEHMQAQDQVLHMDKCNFWLDCNELAKYIKEMYVEMTKTEPFTAEAHTYRYIWPSLEFLHRHLNGRSAVLKPVVETFRLHIQLKGRAYVNVSTKLTGVKWNN
jgi:hypothetical protein